MEHRVRLFGTFARFAYLLLCLAGVVNGVFYFPCKQNHGVLLVPKKVGKAQQKQFDEPLYDDQQPQQEGRSAAHFLPAGADAADEAAVATSEENEENAEAHIEAMMSSLGIDRLTAIQLVQSQKKTFARSASQVQTNPFVSEHQLAPRQQHEQQLGTPNSFLEQTANQSAAVDPAEVAVLAVGAADLIWAFCCQCCILACLLRMLYFGPSASDAVFWPVCFGCCILTRLLRMLYFGPSASAVAFGGFCFGMLNSESAYSLGLWPWLRLWFGLLALALTADLGVA
jgi:hypothetical protein